MDPSRRARRAVVEGPLAAAEPVEGIYAFRAALDCFKYALPGISPANNHFVLSPDRIFVKELSILLADDNEFFREQATTFLDGLSYVGTIWSAENGHQAVVDAIEFEPDVVLLDLSMPIKTGFEILPELVEHIPETIVIVISSLIGDPYGDEVKRLGAAAVVPKERFIADVPELLERIADGDTALG
jgi:CheY-like chemotaxis protein